MSLCPNCEADFDDHESILNPGHLPAPGDVTICAHCAVILVFDDGDEIHPRRLTPEEENEFGSDPTIKRIRQTVLDNLDDWRSATREARRIGES